MSERLLIRLTADGQMHWLALDADGRALSGAQAGPPAFAALERARRIVVLVPTEDVLLLETARLPGARAQWRRALPFALEDRLASPVEELHFSIDERAAGERMAVAIVAKIKLRAWLDALASAGIRPDAIYCEAQALPVTQGNATVAIDGERALWRCGAAQTGACALASAADWLALLNPDAPPALEVHDFRDAPPLSIAATVYQARQRDVLAFLAGRLREDSAINLLQGEFAPVHRQAPAQQLWRKALALSAAALVLLFAYYAADCWRLDRQSAQFTQDARSILHASFPQLDKVAGDPRQLMQSALRGARGDASGAGLMHLLARIAPVLSNGTRSSLTGMEYHNATLELAIRAPDVPTLDLLRESLATLPGLKVEVTAANAGAQGIDGRLRIAGAAP